MGAIARPSDTETEPERFQRSRLPPLCNQVPAAMPRFGLVTRGIHDSVAHLQEFDSAVAC